MPCVLEVDHACLLLVRNEGVLEMRDALDRATGIKRDRDEVDVPNAISVVGVGRDVLGAKC